MVQTYRSSILPVLAFCLTIVAFSYSACQESKADSKSGSTSSELMNQVSKFEQGVNELKTLHAQHLKKYGDQMGCNKNSMALEAINNQNALIDHLASRLQYHKLQLLQADTTNATRNNAQLEELKTDLQQMEVDGKEIRIGFDNVEPSHITK